MPKKTYNGHENWNCWNVSLWINNDEGLYRLAKYYVRTAGTRDKAALLMYQDLRERGVTHTPDKAPYSKTAIRAAMVGM